MISYFLLRQTLLFKFSSCINIVYLMSSLLFYHFLLFKSTYKMATTKQTNIKNRTYYFYNDLINIKDFDARLLKLDKKHQWV